MENFQLTYAAFLFPAIPLMMISFGNRYSSLSLLIRKIHDEFINKKLNLRLKFIQSAQTLSGLAFLFNLLTIFLGILNFLILSISFFLFALSFFSVAMILFILEIQLASKALKTHLEDLEEIE